MRVGPAEFPKFDSDDEAAAWLDSHDTAVFIDPLKAEKMNFSVVRTQFPTRPIDVRLRTDFFAAIETVAARQGVPYQMLVQRWLLEKLSQEAPDLASS